MALNTQTQPQTQEPAASLDRPAPRNGLLFPPGVEDVRRRDVALGFLRWPTILCLPLSVAALIVIGLQSLVVGAVCAPVFATISTLLVVRRASARVTARNARTTLTELVPTPRPSHTL
jgi:hypothetical protein